MAPVRCRRRLTVPARIVTAVRGRAETAMAETYSGEAYCVKCKEKRAFDGHVEEKNGRRFAKGICPVCGTKVTRILGKA
jgi:nitrogen regulatory protein PII